MGGKHGPYRNWSGKFDVYQLSDQEKVWTDKEAMAVAKKMAAEKLQSTLEEIKMGLKGN